MSTLKANTFTGTTSAGSIVVTGEGGSTTTNLQQGLAKCWCHVDSSFGIDDSLNVASTTDEGGSAPNTFSVTMTNALGNSNYIALGTGDGTTNPRNVMTQYTSTSSYFVSIIVSNIPANSTAVVAQTLVHGDLA